ncbi:hypothetical protein [Methanohalobium sp.]|uniref:hypothetical protein n=1 Tax=Methanohalobium sp. TaxID=2837493 RepID=UPI0025DB8702|nr:hypothetical protein [Methanohalobium sp.]
MGGETYNPSSGDKYRSDGSIVNVADTYDGRGHQRRISIHEDKLINEKEVYGYRKQLSLASGASTTILAEATDQNVCYISSRLAITDLDNQIIEVDTSFFKGATINSGDIESDLVVNLNESGSDSVGVNYYDPATLDIDETNRVDLPFGETIKDDRKSTSENTNFLDYVISDNAAIRFTNNGAGSVRIQYFETFYLI